MAYEDVRMIPKGELTREVMKHELSDEGFESFHNSRDNDDGQDKTCTLMSAGIQEKPDKYTGTTASVPGGHMGDWRSEVDKVLNDIYASIGNTQVTRRRLEASPPWVMKKALQT